MTTVAKDKYVKKYQWFNDAGEHRPNLSRFLEQVDLWDQFVVISDKIHELEAQHFGSRASKLVIETGDDPFYFNKLSVSQRKLALDSMLNGLRTEKTRLQGILRNTYHLEV